MSDNKYLSEKFSKFVSSVKSVKKKKKSIPDRINIAVFYLIGA